jgi:hypothetical protein
MSEDDASDTDPQLCKPGRQVVPSGHSPRLHSAFVAQLWDQDDALHISEEGCEETRWIMSQDYVFNEP